MPRVLRPSRRGHGVSTRVGSLEVGVVTLSCLPFTHEVVRTPPGFRRTISTSGDSYDPDTLNPCTPRPAQGPFTSLGLGQTLHRRLPLHLVPAHRPPEH